MSTAARYPAEERLTARIRTAVERYARERGAAPGEGRLDYPRSLADGYAAHREEPGPLAAYLDGSPSHSPSPTSVRCVSPTRPPP